MSVSASRPVRADPPSSTKIGYDSPAFPIAITSRVVPVPRTRGHKSDKAGSRLPTAGYRKYTARSLGVGATTSVPGG